MAKISPKKESDKPRNPIATSFEKINEDLAPAINGLKNLDFSRFTKALGSLSAGSFAEIEAQAYGDEVQINPDLYKLISRPDPDPYPPHIIQQLQDLQAKLKRYEDEDSPAATAQPDEDLPPTLEELLQGITVDELTERLRAIKWLSEGGKWIVAKNRTTVLFNVLRNKDLLQNGCVVKTTVPAIAKYFKLKKIAESYGRPLRERDYSDAQQIANEELNEVF